MTEEMDVQAHLLLSLILCKLGSNVQVCSPCSSDAMRMGVGAS